MSVCPLVNAAATHGYCVGTAAGKIQLAVSVRFDPTVRGTTHLIFRFITIITFLFLLFWFVA